MGYSVVFWVLLGGALECMFTHLRGAPAPLWTLYLDAAILVVLARLALLPKGKKTNP